MKRNIVISILIIILASGQLFSQTLNQRIKNITVQEMQSVIEFLADDLLEGRAPGTRGGNLAELYIQSLFKWMNLKPEIGDRFLQPFILKGFTINELTLNANNVNLNYIDDIVGTWVGKDKNFNLEGEAIFVGFGIVTDLWNWNDYKDVDVKNKIIIARVNDPGMYNDKIFEGKALTYFGRWTYHIEEAARRGAAGILLIHTDESAGYDWNVVKNSWSGEEVYLESDLKNNLKFRGWIKESSLRKVLNSKKIELNKLYKQSLKRNFKPQSLGFSIKIKGKNQKRDVLNHNVVAVIPGKSPQKIVLSAHIDHLGMLASNNSSEDNIFNGAIDNSSAVAAMMVTGKILKEYQSDLYYAIVLLACHSEEAGLLGSKYYVRNHIDRKKIIANINFESTPVWKKTTDFMAIGGRFSTFEDMLIPIITAEGLKYSYFSLVNQGLYYRSDQYSFARYGIPAIWISAGEDDISGDRKYTTFWKTDYHSVRDEYDPQWPLKSMKQTIQITLKLIDKMNKNKAIPQWKGKLTFPIETE